MQPYPIPLQMFVCTDGMAVYLILCTC